MFAVAAAGIVLNIIELGIASRHTFRNFRRSVSVNRLIQYVRTFALSLQSY